MPVMKMALHLVAMASLLASVGSPAAEISKSSASPNTGSLRGQSVYEQHCAACHGLNGKATDQPLSGFTPGLDVSTPAVQNQVHSCRVSAHGRRSVSNGHSWDAGKFNAEFYLPERAEPAHDALLALASDPRELNAAQEPSPGAPCPPCGFATFAWAEMLALSGALSGSTAEAIRAEFPHWESCHGACQRCVAIYRLRNVPSLAVV